VSAAPGEGWNGDDLMSIVEHPPLPKGQGLDFMLRGADPEYFSAIGLPIYRGRTFNEDERGKQANVVLTAAALPSSIFLAKTQSASTSGRSMKTASGQ
jgi:hypothetical protein